MAVVQGAARRGAPVTLTLVLVLALCAAVVLLAAAHLLDQQRHYGSWSWSAASPTERLPFRDHEYARGTTLRTFPPGLVRVGTTWDGLPILGPGDSASAPTGVEVQVGPSEFVSYSLEGGP